MRRALVLFLVMAALAGRPAAQVRLPDASDRAAFRAWFVFLADAQFYRPTPDVVDCAALVRHAIREALRPHTPEWIRTANLPLVRTFPDVRNRPPVVDGGLAIFRVSRSEPARHAEFADARTIIQLNARLVGRDVSAARPGDLLYFHQPSQRWPDHLMVFVGESIFEPGPSDWLVYHTGPSSPRDAAASGRHSAAPPAPDPGEVRKVRLADLLQHPAPRWRPVATNPAFVGVYRLAWL